MFQQIELTKASQAVEAQLLALIQSGAIRVGEKLPGEITLAQEFGVSRTVVREALGALKALGLLSSRSGSGTFVIAVEPRGSPLSLADGYTSDELHELRMHLEIPGAGLAARRRTSDQLE